MCERTIVVDNGSGSIYAGFAEEEDPISTFQNFTRIKKAGDRQTQYGDSCGDFSDAVKYRNFVDEITNGNVKINYPMERGIVVDWDGMEAVWSHTFSKVLNAKPEECNLLITEATMNPKPNREKMAQTLFEKFGFPAISIEQAGILPLYSAGLTTGVVLDCGDGVVETVPVWGGYPISDAIKRVNIGGRDISELLGKLLQEKGHASKQLEILRFIKENTAYVSERSGAGHPSTSRDIFELPDGEIITIEDEIRHRCSELLFNPSMLEESDKIGVHEMLYKSIMKTNMDIRKDLYGNIVLSGGSTLFPGFVERLSKEIASLLPQKAKLTIRASPDRRYATWKGASVLASLSNFSRLLISKQEYDDVGPVIMHKHK
ncbi:actin-3 [Folsomia candida]|uniref:Actin n=1 Tax=Folsomia candida TaxID=158441 RepID=A0A226F4E9_FOLCA|nr:actin-3 [Folsomia candida]OXA63796.1 actin [Folsomia candida]